MIRLIRSHAPLINLSLNKIPTRSQRTLQQQNDGYARGFPVIVKDIHTEQSALTVRSKDFIFPSHVMPHNPVRCQQASRVLFGLFPLKLGEVFHLPFGKLHLSHRLDTAVVDDSQQALIGNSGMVDLDVGELEDECNWPVAP